MCFETCIRRSQFDDHRDKGRNDDGEDGGDLDSESERFLYRAISYAWGDPTPSHPIIVDGHRRLVATNLWHFLQHIYRRDETSSFSKDLLDFLRENRLRTESRRCEHWLWIDALCINQWDARERTHQVGVMSEIFGRADQVVAWLGPAYDNSDHAMATIRRRASRYNTNKHTTLNQTELSEAIRKLCERPYWKRLWIFQELKHAKCITLMCGASTISWDQFAQLWRTIVEIATTDKHRSKRLKHSLATRMMTLRSKPINFSLWNLLKETQNLECADRRDRVYALLSVATTGHEGIEADYNIDPLSLAHRILHIKYSMRRPGTLDDLLLDCRFLESVFGMFEGAMFRYRQYDAGGYNDTWVRAQWCRWEWYLMEKHSHIVEEGRVFNEFIREQIRTRQPYLVLLLKGYVV
jgi:hypothetical protein